jgi:hypothetical protein
MTKPIDPEALLDSLDGMTRTPNEILPFLVVSPIKLSLLDMARMKDSSACPQLEKLEKDPLVTHCTCAPTNY